MQTVPTAVLLLAALTCIAAQYNPMTLMNPMGMSPLGMNPLGMNAFSGNPYHLWALGNQMHATGSRPMAWNPLATWRTHPGFRMAAGDKPAAMIIPTTASAAVPNVPKVSPAEEVLTHAVLANQNVKPFVDHIGDVLYSQEPGRGRQAMVSPLPYVSGMNPVRNTQGPMDDCTPQDVARWNREIMEWVY